MTTLNELVAGKQPMAATIRTTTITVCDPEDGERCGVCFSCKILNHARIAVEQARVDHLEAQARVNNLHVGLSIALHAMETALTAAKRDVPMAVDEIVVLGHAINGAQALVRPQVQVIDADEVAAGEPAA